MPSTNGHGSKAEPVALYLRVSSEEQRDRETIEIQEEFLDQYCGLYDLEVAEIYKDDGVSGTIPLHERPEGRRLLGDKLVEAFDVAYRKSVVETQHRIPYFCRLLHARPPFRPASCSGNLHPTP